MVWGSIKGLSVGEKMDWVDEAGDEVKVRSEVESTV